MTSAVDAYAGPGNYSWDGTTLTWTATAEGQTPTSLDLTVTTIQDITVEDAENFAVSLSNPGSATGATVGLGASNSVTTTITDDDTATVSIAPTTDGNEASAVVGEFTVTITAASSTDTVLNYTLGGTSTSNADYTAVSGQVTILAGDTTAIITIATIDDNVVESTETVSATLTGIASGDAEVSLGGATEATINLFDNDQASWEVTGDPTVNEGATATYNVVLNGPLGNGESADVELSITNGTTSTDDYADFDTAVTTAVATYAGPGNYVWDGSVLTWTATADAQTPTALTITLATTDDAIVEANETLTVSVANPNSTTGASVILGGSTSINTTINDNDTATISIAAATDGNETGNVNGEFTVTITEASSTDTIVDYTIGGTATSGSDFTAVTGQITIAAGATTATITIPTINDAIVEGPETVSATLTAISTGDPDISLGGTTSATIDIIDSDAGTWSISGDATVTEGNTATYTVALSGIFADAENASVDVSLADIDTSAGDYADLGAAVASAVAAYTGDGNYNWNGTTLTWTSDAENQTAGSLSYLVGDDGRCGTGVFRRLLDQPCQSCSALPVSTCCLARPPSRLPSPTTIWQRSRSLRPRTPTKKVPLMACSPSPSAILPRPIL